MQPSSTKKEGKSKVPYLFIAGGALVLAIAAGLLLRTPASATSSFLSLAESQYPFIVGSRIDTCNLCHVPNAIPNLNAYGTAFLNNGLNAAALVAIENLDSDGDGFTNIQELRALTFPGDPNDKPQAATATPTMTRVPTTVPTTVPTKTPTGVPTVVPTTVPSPTATVTLAPVPTGTVGPTQTATATLTAVPTVQGPTPTVQCRGDDERKERHKKSHGDSEDRMAAKNEANEEAIEERMCKDHEEGNDIEEANESEQAQLHEQENDENEISEANETDQVEMGEQGNQNLEDNQGQQDSLGKDLAFLNSIDLWLSQWSLNVGFHD